MRVNSGERALRTATLTGVGTLGAVLLVHLWDPNTSGSYGFCPLRVTTGLLCPMCGGLRAVHALTHGQWETAWGLNPALMVLLPVMLGAWAVWVWRARRGRPSTYAERREVFVPALVLFLLFGVTRNIGAFEPYLSRLTS